MSKYSPGHGKWPIDSLGFYPHPTNPSQTQQPQMSYDHPPTDPTAVASYMNSHKSFGFNSTQIPGLGFGGSSASAGNTPLPYQNSLIPPPPPMPNYSQQQASNSPGATVESTEQPPQPTLVVKQPMQTTQEPMEEGELSDADFDDLYDPQPEQPAYQQPSSVAQKSQSAQNARPNSYSPQLFANEVSRSEMTETAFDGSRAASQNAKPTLPGLGLHSNPDNACNMPAQSSQAILQFRSVDEAKKEAQKAILRLLPLGVKYQTYIDEGFDEATVKALFNELNLLPPSIPAKPATQLSTPAKPAAENVPVSEGSTSTPKTKTEERKDRIARLLAAKAANKTSSTPAALPKPATTSPTPTQLPTQTSATSPSDAGTLSASVAPTEPSIPSAPSMLENVPPPLAPTAPLALRKDEESAVKSKSKADKEALLKKKLEALKSRQAQKQVATTPVIVIQPTQQTAPPTVDSRPSITRPPSASSLPFSSGNGTTPRADGLTSSQTHQFIPSPVGLNSQSGSSIPGLSLATDNLGLAQSRKRPVAADFVDYSATVGTPKRPFGQNRQDSFVIDISEESDDDVEMEVDSPGGNSVSSSSRIDTPNRGHVIRDFPPLSDGTPRKSMARSNSNMPPAKLNKLDSDILRMRAKIAAAEAKKRMTGSGSQTPDVSTSTPELKEPSAPSVDSADQARPTVPPQRTVSSSDVESTDLPSAQLISEAASASVPRLPEQAPLVARSKQGYGQLGAVTAPSPMRPIAQTAAAEGDRRQTRITGCQLPKIEARLLEKKTKLKLLEHKAAQLRREIEIEAVEREKLAEELRQLEGEPTAPEPLGEDHVPQKPSEDAAAPKVSQPSEETTESAENPAPVPQFAPSASLADSQDTWPMQADERNPAVEELALAQESLKDNMTVSNVSLPINDTAAEDQKTLAPVVDAPVTMEFPEPPMPELNESPQEDVVMASTSSTPESGQIDESAPPSPRGSNSGSTSSDESQIPMQITPALNTESISSERAEESPDIPMISDVVDANDDTEHTVDITGEAPVDPKEDEVPSFTPYESPLSYFRAYRFHPKYSETVTGGLKSLTYTNKINPKQALCLNELTQKKCNDPECGFQHFKSMVPRDDQILMELGQADDFADGDEKSRFITGLRDLLAECRAQKVRDMDEIGRAIIEYRRRFIGDQSRVLTSLQGTKI